MSTKDTPESKLRRQAAFMARNLKAMAIAPLTHLSSNVREARGRDVFTTGIVMDDKFIKIEMPWTNIRESTELALTEYIVKLMREERES